MPKLDIRITNNTEQTVLLNEVEFCVRKSAHDPTPIIVVSEERWNIFCFRLCNEGWGSVSSCNIEFNIQRANEEPNWVGEYRHRLEIGEFDNYYTIDISPQLQQHGVDVDILRKRGDEFSISLWELRRLGWFADADKIKREIEEKGIVGAVKKAVKNFEENYVLLAGSINYSGIARNGRFEKQKLRFLTYVYLVAPGPGAALPPSYSYDIILDADRNDYIARIPISQVLKEGEADRFFIRVGATKSSEHDFIIRVSTNSGDSIESPRIHLKILVPRSSSCDQEMQLEV